ncbi:hypothetical protein [Pseudoroseicyclus tamaricis]|uniref:Transmembrane protein n=1 Tax=Pseudoroseicyclus tamaricis TaxID=2705421 RepID=A0A6B2JQ93_9RHOB|nr:hypothetical protein [Pseudoroseicyclus tamaricis]NDV00298.1 hypothetical protein [Pseudoroseicyclus tamaricis]
MTDGKDAEKHEFREESESLWRIAFAPAIWAIHFVVCYAWVSLVCVKFGGDPAVMRVSLLAISAVALAAIAWLGWRAFRQWNVRDTGDFTNPEGEAEDRHEFLGHAAFLLAIISAIGVIYVSMPLIIIEGCR